MSIVMLFHETSCLATGTSLDPEKSIETACPTPSEPVPGLLAFRSWLNEYEHNEGRIASIACNLDQSAPRRPAVEQPEQWQIISRNSGK